MTGLKEYVYPESLEQALAILSEKGARAMAVAGGTSLALRQFEVVETLVDINSVVGSTIEKKDGFLIIGAATRVEDVARSELVKSLVPSLAAAAAAVGSPQIRNAATIGGGLYLIPYWADLPGVVLALDASLEISNRGSMKYSEVVANHPSKVLSAGQMILSVKIPLPAPACAFETFARTKVDYALFDVAVSGKVKGKSIENLKVAVSGMTRLPVLLETIGNELSGRELDQAIVDESVVKAFAALQLRNDIRSEDEYRRHTAGVIARRLILGLLGGGDQ